MYQTSRHSFSYTLAFQELLAELISLGMKESVAIAKIDTMPFSRYGGLGLVSMKVFASQQISARSSSGSISRFSDLPQFGTRSFFREDDWAEGFLTCSFDNYDVDIEPLESNAYQVRITGSTRTIGDEQECCQWLMENMSDEGWIDA